MRICVVVHPINTLAHPTVPPGWRWAVHISGSADDVRSCVNAGWAPDRNEAARLGEAVAVCGVAVARLLGAEAYIITDYLEGDPIPAGRDLIRFGA